MTFENLTVAQLLEALKQCPPTSLVQFFDGETEEKFNVVFVDRFTSKTTVYLENYKPHLKDENGDPIKSTLPKHPFLTREKS